MTNQETTDCQTLAQQHAAQEHTIIALWRKLTFYRRKIARLEARVAAQQKIIDGLRKPRPHTRDSARRRAEAAFR